MIAYIINSQSIGNCVDYVTRRTLEEKLANKKKMLNFEKKYESCGGRDMTEHLSSDWQLLDHSPDIRVYAGRKLWHPTSPGPQSHASP